MKRFKAMVWSNGDKQPGKQVTIEAASLEAARVQLEQEFGKENVFDLHDVEEASRPR